MPAEEAPSRWQRRAALSTTIRVAVFCAPIAASFAAAYAVHAALPPVTGLAGQVGSLAVLVGVSTIVLLLVDRLGRRAVPLATLLDLSMLFPDRAPSRVKVARDAIKRRPIEEQLARVRKAGADPGAVAREILTLVATLSRHDRPTRGHAERVRMFTDLLAAQMKIPSRDRDLLRWAAILHDIGKLKVPASLLNKPGKPTDEEWTLLKAHPSHGAEMAEALLPWLGEWGDVIVQHHERYDGTGYPNGIGGHQIGLGARIVSVADAYDVMTAARAYKRPVSRSAALKELVKFSGSQFDPVVVRAMVAVGAPRLRRAQGLVAWVADLPLVATTTVPAATIARVVGAGAIATGAATGGVAVADVSDSPSTGRTAVTASEDARDRAAREARESPDSPVDSAEADRTPTRPQPPPTAAAADAADAAGATTEGAPNGDGGGKDTGGSGSGGSGSGGSGSGGSDSGGSGGSGPVEDVTDTVEKVVKDPVGTVGDTVEKVVKDPVGTVGSVVGGVTEPVGEVVEDPVGAVTDPVGTVGGVVGGVTGTVGGLLGGSGSSTPSPSPSPKPSGGLLGGLLGK
jgi:putative nucleotidyltransferase with HDIG domain